MKIENAKEITILVIVAISLIVIIPSVRAVSIGISPSEKTVELEENTAGVVYFAISQSSTEIEKVDISVDANWLKPEMASFDLSPGEQKFLKFTIDPLPIGTYTAKVKASTSISPAMRTSVTSVLTVSVVPGAETSGLENRSQTEANDAIVRAQEAIRSARDSGIDTADAENVLTNAMEEYDKGNYDSAKKFADLAYSLAISKAEKTEQAKAFLDPIKFAFIVIGIGSAAVLGFLIYEITKSRSSKKILTKDGAKKCPRCGAKSFLSYDGTFISNFRCTKCGYGEIRDKHYKM